MKKFYFLTLALICAITANAQDVLYMVGYNGAWDPANPTEIPYNTEKGVYYLEGVDFTNTELKISEQKGSWNKFNEKAICIADDKTVEIGVATKMYKYADTNVKIASTGTFDVEIDLKVPTITLKESAVVVPQVDIVGGTVLYMKPNATWKANNARFAAYFFDNNDTNAWASMEFVVDDTYSVTAPEGTWTNVIFCSMKGDNQTNDWNNKVQQTADLKYDGENNLYDIATNKWSVASDVVTAIEEVGVDAGEAVYYNLQGVKVANPENGIFIKKQGNKTTKVVL